MHRRSKTTKGGSMNLKRFSFAKLLCFVLIAFCLTYAEWMPFKQGTAQKIPAIQPDISTSSTFTFSLSIPGCEVNSITNDGMINTTGETFSLLSIPEYSYIGDVAKPKLPAIRQTIGVPHNATISHLSASNIE
jgi:hypothetical protein